MRVVSPLEIVCEFKVTYDEWCDEGDCYTCSEKFVETQESDALL